LSPVLEQLPSKFHRTLEESSEISSWATNSSFLPVSSDNSPASSPKATRTLQLRSRDIQVTSRDAQASQQRRIPIASAQRGPTIHLDVNVQYGGPTASQDSEEEEQEEVEDRDDLDTRVPPETRACAELYFERLNTAQAPNNLDIEDSTSQSISTSYRQLAQLPTVFKPLPTHALRHFGHACERMASVYLAEPSDLALFDILALPKVGLAPALSSKTPAAVRTVLDAYPAVPWPEISPSIHLETRARTLRLVEAGRLSSAARSLVGQAKIADTTPQVIADLEAKHPAGQLHPFGLATGPLPSKAPDLEDINLSLKRFASDTAPGVSGWTVPLLRQAIKLPQFGRFMVSLTASMAKGTAPGAAMLCTSRLTPLLKPDGGIRPIAVGELFYRLATKAILKAAFKKDFLLPNQLGVGSKGGVEPIVRAVERGLEGSLPQHYTHLVSLDFSNAFNTADRLEIATSLKAHAPGIYRLAKWAYNNSSDLLIGDQALKSAQGVRQGDPLGPLLFSLAIRPLLRRLMVHLGDDRLVLAYLDDIYVLSKDSTALADTYSFFEKETTSLELNKRKCASVSFEDIKRNGFKLLGTVVGPPTTRLDFLNAATASVASKLDQLRHLPHQHALILLRQCIQQDVRHLQRTLKTDDLPGCWAALDNRLSTEVKRLAAGRPDASDTVDALVKLPARFGGLGILSHADCSAHAKAAAQDDSDAVLTPLLGVSARSEQPNTTPEPETLSQAARCSHMWKDQQDNLLKNMDDKARKLLVEAASPIGRKWISIIPYNPTLRLSDYDVATGLAYRLQSPSDTGHCLWCGDKSELGHDELCLTRPRATIGRHDAVVRTIGRYLASDHSTQVEIEPHTQEGRRRNDIQWNGAPSHGRATIHFDIKVVSLLGAKSHKTTTRAPAETELVTHAAKQCIKHLDAVGRHATSVRPLSTATFKPLVFSTGGLMSKETTDEVQSWKGALGDSVFGRLGSAISLELVRARARTFGLLR